MHLPNCFFVCCLSVLTLAWPCVPAHATDISPVRFALVGDQGLAGAPALSVSHLVHSWHPDFIVTLGDNNYPEGAAETMEANIGGYYGDYIASDSTNRFFPTLGNHDWRAPGARPYLDYFVLPGNERYYQVQRGPLDIFVVDSDVQEPDGVTANSVQGQWLKAALAASTARWKLVTLHHPPYSSGKHGPSYYTRWPFAAWGASLVFSGHDHNYERLQVHGLTYVVAGTGGARLKPMAAQGYEEATVDVRYNAKHGALYVEASESALSVEFINVDHEVVDSFHLP